MGVCESTEHDEDTGDFHAAAMSSSGKTHLRATAEFDMEVLKDPTNRLVLYDEYQLVMGSSQLEIKDGDDVIWTLSYFDIIAWGSSTTTFKLVLKMSQFGYFKKKAPKKQADGKEATFEVKFSTHQGKRAALAIRSYCLNLLEEMEDAEAERKLADREKEWEATLNRTDAEKGNVDNTADDAEEEDADDADGNSTTKEDASTKTAQAQEAPDELDMMSISTIYHDINAEKKKKASRGSH